MRNLSQLNAALRKRGAYSDFYGGGHQEGFLFSSLESAPEEKYDEWWGYLLKDNFEDKEWRAFALRQGELFIEWLDTE